MNISGNKILITGGSTGIGLGLAERFLKENNSVIIIGRRKDALDAAAEKFPGLITRVADISFAEGREELAQWISSHHPDLNVLE